MKYVVLFFLLTQAFFGNSQALLDYPFFFVGDSKEDVKYSLSLNKVPFTEDVLTDTTSRIAVYRENEYEMIWILDSNDVVISQTLVSDNEDMNVNKFIEWFNKDFVIISDTEWRNYAKGNIYIIKFGYISEFRVVPFFSITLL